MKPKIIFMGTGSFAGTILEALLKERCDIIGVFTKPDKTVHKNTGPKENSVKEIASSKNISIYQPEKLDDAVISQLKEIQPDLIIIVAYGKIIPQEIIDIPEFGCMNVHPSLLPKFRGPSPIQNALLQGEKETGTTIMLINEKMDEGNILAQEKMAIGPDDTYQSLSQKLASFSADLLLRTLPLWIEKKIAPLPQDDSQATLCQLIEREDGHIVWEEEAEKIYDRYRALSPWPGIFSFWKDGEKMVRIKLQKVSLKKDAPKSEKYPGEIFRLDDQLAVQTLKGAIILEEVQLEGKKATDVKNFINGYPKFVGSILK